jgi:phosphoglycerol transferase MdoB-like AlkP superfamily enzyme
MQTILCVFPRTAICATFYSLAALVLTLYRLRLYSEKRADLDELTLAERFRLFWVGFRLDSIIIGRAVIVPVLLLLVLPEPALAVFKSILLFYGTIIFFIIFFAETAGIYFFRYYDFRPNYLVLDYGGGPEVLRTIIKDYPVLRILALCAAGTAAGVFIFWQTVHYNGCMAGSMPHWLWDRGGAFICMMLIGFATRGSLSHRPLNPGFAAITHNRIANEIAGCGIFNVLYEWDHNVRKEFIDLKTVVKTLSSEEARKRSQALLSGQGPLTSDSPNPLVRVINVGKQEKPLNVVLVVMESCTSRLVGALGGNPGLTPELDELAARGMLWEQCYATGERTIQGLEAVVSSFPPLPGTGVVKRPQARQRFATLAGLLKERGYATQFLYGGEGMFDNMRAFFMGNGFDTFIEERDFSRPVFRGTWGVSDEDLFIRADQEFRALFSRGCRFFATLLTVSLHSPWQYPPGRIQSLPAGTLVPPGFVLEELNNFRYADYAIGRFMREARKAPWFDDTLFVFVGDHGVHLRGRDLIPVDEFRVPALFYAPAHVPAQRISAVTSQIDIAPTIMGILGGEYRSPFFGRDVLRHSGPEDMALMIYNKKRYGIVSGSNLVVLAENGETLAYERDHAAAFWRPIPPAPMQQEISCTARALLGTAQELLVRGCYSADAHAESVPQST